MASGIAISAATARGGCRPSDGPRSLHRLAAAADSSPSEGVDISGGLMALAAGTLAYLLDRRGVGPLGDRRRMGFWTRFLCWLLAAGHRRRYFVARISPPLLHRINPIFAAQTIEQSRPS